MCATPQRPIESATDLLHTLNAWARCKSQQCLVSGAMRCVGSRAGRSGQLSKHKRMYQQLMLKGSLGTLAKRWRVRNAKSMCSNKHFAERRQILAKTCWGHACKTSASGKAPSQLCPRTRFLERQGGIGEPRLQSNSS